MTTLACGTGRRNLDRDERGLLATSQVLLSFCSTLGQHSEWGDMSPIREIHLRVRRHFETLRILARGCEVSIDDLALLDLDLRFVAGIQKARVTKLAWRAKRTQTRKHYRRCERANNSFMRILKRLDDALWVIGRKLELFKLLQDPKEETFRSDDEINGMSWRDWDRIADPRSQLTATF